MSTNPPDDLIHPSNPPKDPMLMAILSGCLLAGVGQMILGQMTKGLTLLVVGIVLGTITFGIAIPVFWILMAVDAYQLASKLKNGQPIRQWEFFWEK
ncbi:MAG: hypothetical protein AAFN70_11780 [Planctomycetota bacterium]